MPKPLKQIGPWGWIAAARYQQQIVTRAALFGCPLEQSVYLVCSAKDGYPVYGPYAYSDPMDPSSGVRRMVSGYIIRDGSYGTSNLNVTGRTTLPFWAQLSQNRTNGLN